MSATDFHTDDAIDEAPAKTRKRHPEWDLQTACYVWAKRNITTMYLWLSIDRGAGTKMQRLREAARGFKAGTPDVLLLIEDGAVFVEIKAPRGTVSAAQKQMAELIAGVGHEIYVAHSVAEFCYAILEAGFSVHPLGLEHALAADRALAARIAAPPKKHARTRAAPRFTMGKRAVGRARKAGMFI